MRLAGNDRPVLALGRTVVELRGDRLVVGLGRLVALLVRADRGLAARLIVGSLPAAGDHVDVRVVLRLLDRALEGIDALLELGDVAFEVLLGIGAHTGGLPDGRAQYARWHRRPASHRARGRPSPPRAAVGLRQARDRR